MMDGFFDGQTDCHFWADEFLDGRFQKKFLTDCKTNFLTDCFGKVLGKFLANFGNFLAFFFAILGQNLGKIELFPWRTFFFVRTVNFYCGADLSAVRLEMTTIRQDGRVYGSIRRPLVCLSVCLFVCPLPMRFF